MRVMDFFLVRAIHRSKEDGGAPSGAAGLADDSRASRRALLTGGFALAGASALGSKAEAAPTYVQLGASNNASTLTTIAASTDAAAFRGLSSKAGGIGVWGTANSGANSKGVQGNSTQGSGVFGAANSGAGVQGTSTSGVGVIGSSTSQIGVNGSGGYSGGYFTGGSYGVIAYGNNSGAYGGYFGGQDRGVHAAGGTYGVYGAGTTYGVYGSGPYGLYGKGQYGLYATGTTGGIYSTTTNSSGAGVYGVNGQYGVAGSGGGTAGVRGDSNYVGVWGAGANWGLYGQATATSGTRIGVQGLGNGSGSYGVYSSGDCHVNGTLSKTAGSFKIDHPLDPEHKWLQHSFVESPDMMNVYNGNVTTNADGLAVVKLPAYFGALNRDFRYQLTVIGKMAHAVIDQEVVSNQFRIRTDQGNVKVSWQVTGIRQDDYAKEHPILVEIAKRNEHMGTREFIPKGKVGRLMKMTPTDPGMAIPGNLPDEPTP